MTKDELNLDYETKSEINLLTAGLDRYAADPSTDVLMAAWSVNGGTVQQWDRAYQRKMPAELREAIESPEVDKWAFNAQFERVITNRVLNIHSPHQQWRCTMALAYIMGFAGNLDAIGRQMGMTEVKSDGQKLIKMFSCPQKPTKKQPRIWLDAWTNPMEWDEFLGYNRQDVVAEMAIKKALIKYPVPESEWQIYWMDQIINDRGVYIDQLLARQALAMAEQRKEIITGQMAKITGLQNPSSPAQLLPWLQERGYRFKDVGKDTVVKVLKENKSGEFTIPDNAKKALQLRQAASKTSTSKYVKMLTLVGPDGFLRYQLQYYGAQRTGRFAGRGVQVHNLPRTPKGLENMLFMGAANDAIRKGELDWLDVVAGEPMDSLVGCIRSAFVPKPGRVFRVADLSSIESVVIGWLTDCEWFLETLREGRDLYRAFAAVWLRIPYEETKPHRSKAKPATLGAGYRLGGGDIITTGKKAGQKSGLWGYAENMNVELTKEEAVSSVKAFRDLCPEIVSAWKALEVAAKRCVKEKTTVKCGKVIFEFRSPFMCIILPSGRRTYYYKPRVEQGTVTHKGETFNTTKLTYMGRLSESGGPSWGRMETHGGKLIENIVQAIARDVLTTGMTRAMDDGFEIPLHVHDEIVTEADPDDDYHTVERLIKHMTETIPWAPDLPLGAAGWEGTFYRKD